VEIPGVTAGANGAATGSTGATGTTGGTTSSAPATGGATTGSAGTGTSTVETVAPPVVTPVAPPVVAVTITGAPPTTVFAGALYSFQPTTTPSSGLSFTIAGKPAWASFDAATGRLTGTPGSDSIGNYAGIVITAATGTSSAALAAFSIQVQPAPVVVPPNSPPTIAGTPATSVTAGSAYSFQPSAADANGDALVFSVQNCPAWATFNTSTGRLAGTPDASRVGTSVNVVISVSDGRATVSLPAFAIAVDAQPNVAPTISGTPAMSVVAGNPFAFQPVAADANGDALTFSIQNRPSWANFNSSTGYLGGTPNAGQVGSWSSITISVSDAKASTSLAPFTVQVLPPPNAPPTISGSPAASVVAGSAYTFQPAASDANGDALSFTIQNKPTWASFNTATGYLGGTPTAAQVGTYSNIVVSVSDGKATIGLAPFAIQVLALPNTPPQISGNPAGSVVAGSAYAFQPAASDANGDALSFTIQNKPGWAAFNTATGYLGGTPSAAQVGTYSNIVISASDGKTSTALPAFAIQVQSPPNSPPTIAGSPGTNVTAGNAYSFQPNAADANGDALTFSIQNKPSWATFNVSNGNLVGTPDASQVGSYYNILISVSDGKATVSLPAFTLVVAPAVIVVPDPGTNAGVAQGAAPVNVCTTALVGSHATYDVGPGRAYAELDNVPFGALVAGDVVNIHARGTPYRSVFGLRAQGTSARPVIINGVTDGSCNKPVIDFDGARTAAGSNPGNGQNVYGADVQYNEALAGIIVKRGPSVQDAYGVYEPKWIVIQGLAVRGARKGSTFTTLAGGTFTRGSAACIWIQSGEDITIRNNDVSDCAFGIFLMAKDNMLSETTVRANIANNRVYFNGVVGSYSEHGFYVQAASPVVEGNYIGQVRPGSQGSSYKSRASGEVFRRNYVVCSAFCADFVQTEEQTNGIALQPDYGTDYVYGNTFISEGSAIHYGGDNMGEQNSNGTTSVVFVPPVPYRKHLRFWNNTFNLSTSTYRLWLFKLSAQETQMDAWGNTFNLTFTGGGQLSWLGYAGQLRLGPGNVINGPAPVDAQTDSGAVAPIFSVIKGAPIPNDPRLLQLN
jgi:parallel beta-helix repeat protein